MDAENEKVGFVETIDLSEIAREPLEEDHQLPADKRVLIALITVLGMVLGTQWLLTRGARDAEPIAVPANSIGTLVGEVTCRDSANDVRRVKVADAATMSSPTWLDAREMKVEVSDTQLIIEWKMGGDIPGEDEGFWAWKTREASWAVALHGSDPTEFAGEPRFANLDITYDSGDFTGTFENIRVSGTQAVSRSIPVEVDGRKLTSMIDLEKAGRFPPEFMIFANVTSNVSDGSGDGYWALTDVLCGDLDKSRFSEEIVLQ